MFIVQKKINHAIKSFITLPNVHFVLKKFKPFNRKKINFLLQIPLKTGILKTTKFNLTKTCTPISKTINKDYFFLKSIYLQSKATLTVFNLGNSNFLSLIKFIWVLELNAIVSSVFSQNSLKLLYKAGYGSYALLWKINYLKKKVWLRLPSKKSIIVDLWAYCIDGHEFFTKKKTYIAKTFKMNFRKKKKNVCGVAMNAFNHKNGGSSNRKPLFFNKYNKIAKNNK